MCKKLGCAFIGPWLQDKIRAERFQVPVKGSVVLFRSGTLVAA